MNWFRKWWNSLKPAKPFVQGMTLAPGESAKHEFTLPVQDFPPELQAMLLSGTAKVTLGTVPAVKIGDHQYYQEAWILVDGKPVGRLRLEYSDAEKKS